MRYIVVISSFDPINDYLGSAITKFSSDDTTFLFYFLYSNNAKLENRRKMVELYFQNIKINYDVDFSISEEQTFNINLISIFNHLNMQNKNDLYLLALDEIPTLISFDTIKKYNMSYSFSDSIISDDTQIRMLKNLKTNKNVIDYIVDEKLYFMNNICHYYTEKRLKHAISVANTAYDIAKSNNIDNYDQYYIAGILHDIGKELDEKKSLNLMEKYFNKYKEFPKWSWHQFCGTIIIEKIFPYVNDECLKAIFYHSTGNSHLTKMQKIIYSADKIEPTRGYDSNNLIQACKNDYYAGFVAVLKENNKFIVEKNGLCETNSFTTNCISYYLNGKEE